MIQRLAIDGGTPVRSDLLVFGQPVIGEDEIAEVVDSMRRHWIGTGPKVTRFQEAFRGYVGSPYARAVSSCTAGLHLALLTAGVRSGDEVITSAMTFGATANAIVHVGATPKFVDVRRGTQNINPDRVQAAISDRTTAIVPVHMAGLPCEMNEIYDIAKTFNLRVIEDAAHAVGAEYCGKKIGGLERSDFAVFSFYATKNLTTGEGGMITTRSREAAEVIERSALHGLSVGAWQRYADEGFKHYEVLEPGFKYNMTDLAAAIGIHQLKRLDGWLKRRADIVAQYDEALADLPITRPNSYPDNVRHAHHLYSVFLDLEQLTRDRDWIVNALHKENVGAGIHFTPIHLHPYYRKTFGHQTGEFPEAEWIGERTISLPLSGGLSDYDVDSVVEAVRKVVQAVYL